MRESSLRHVIASTRSGRVAEQVEKSEAKGASGIMTEIVKRQSSESSASLHNSNSGQSVRRRVLLATQIKLDTFNVPQSIFI